MYLPNVGLLVTFIKGAVLSSKFTRVRVVGLIVGREDRFFRFQDKD